MAAAVVHKVALAATGRCPGHINTTPVRSSLQRAARFRGEAPLRMEGRQPHMLRQQCLMAVVARPKQGRAITARYRAPIRIHLAQCSPRRRHHVICRGVVRLRMGHRLRHTNGLRTTAPKPA